MKIALTLDPDVAALLAEEMRHTGSGLKAAVNRELRRALAGTPVASNRRFRVRTHSFGFRADTDPDRMNQLYDEVEAANALAKLARPRSRSGISGPTRGSSC
ncbi:MAG TPA: hypothetical protein VFP94_09330 [Terriglobales bacterium]|nr:hypothetical protein [Terriglobales bacterium]